MGPVKRLRKKKKTNLEGTNASSLASGSSEKKQSLDCFDDFSKTISGHITSAKVLARFESVFGVSRKTFDYIISLVKEDYVEKQGNFFFANGTPMSLYDQVAVALRRLSSGESLLNIGNAYGLNHSTVSQVTWRFIESMEQCGIHHLHWPSTDTEMTAVKSKFEKISGLPNCCGAIDFTHILMNLKASEVTTKTWLDYEKNFSMVFQAIVDPEMRFIDIVTGWPGKMNEEMVFRSSNVHKLFESGKRLNGKSLELSDGSNMREYIVGDSGYPLLPYLITPYEGKEQSDMRSEFNKHQFAIRMVAQRALARLKNMWKIIQGVMWRPDRDKLPRIILVCCLLHNIVIDMEDEVQDDMPLSHQHDPGYHQQICGIADVKGMNMRERLCLYLSRRLAP